MADTLESILEPDLPIVDPHHHLWDRPTDILKNLPPSDHPFMEIVQRVPRYLLDELLADLNSGHDVRATVYLECGAMYRAAGPEPLQPVGEIEFVNGVAAMTASGLYGVVRACAGIVGHADLRMGAAVEDVLAKLGLSFDSWLLEPQLPDLIDLARAFPQTTIVLDHVGTPLGIGVYAGKRDERFAVWRDNIRKLAASANVVVKLGGLAMPFAAFPWSYERRPRSSEDLATAWKPYIDTCIDAFGPTRAMFESNYPR